MKVKFWGTRGSLPVAATASDIRLKIIAALNAANGREFSSPTELEAFVDHLPFTVAGGYGGHSSCVELITEGEEHIICDLGSGVRPLGQAKIAQFGPARPQIYHIFLSHLHWDHLMGLPFFVPIYIPGTASSFTAAMPDWKKRCAYRCPSRAFLSISARLAPTLNSTDSNPGAHTKSLG